MCDPSVGSCHQPYRITADSRGGLCESEIPIDVGLRWALCCGVVGGPAIDRSRNSTVVAVCASVSPLTPQLERQIPMIDLKIATILGNTRPNRVGGMVASLFSDDGAFVNGQTILVDGVPTSSDDPVT